AHGCGGEEVQLVLVPRRDAEYERLELRADPKSGAVRETAVVDLLGNRTTIALSDLKSNKNPDPALFRFAPPAGTPVTSAHPAPRGRRPPRTSSRFSKRGTPLPNPAGRGAGRCGVDIERWRSDARVKIAPLARAALQLRLAGGTQPPRTLLGGDGPRGTAESSGQRPQCGDQEGRKPAQAGEAPDPDGIPGSGTPALRARIQLDTQRCSDMLTAPETFEISRGFESSARCVGRGRPASRVVADSEFRAPAPAPGPDGVRVGDPLYLHMSAATRNALATEWQRTDECLMGGAVSKATRACNSHMQRSERRWIPLGRTQIGGGTSLAAHTERMVPRRRVEPLSEERVR